MATKTAPTAPSASAANSAGKASLDAMPAEMINAIFESLRPHDLTKVAQVLKKYRDIAQSLLWRSIELHRRDAHHDCYGLSSLDNIRRNYLDNQLLDPWSYRGPDGVDHDFGCRNAKFRTAIRKLYRSAGKSRAWSRLSPLVQHICITVTHKSPPQIWDMILSLPNLISVEVIGEYASSDQGPSQPTSLRDPRADQLRNVRLRGYVPAKFVLQMFKASTSSITSLDLGALEPPEVYIGDKYEMELQPELGYALYVAPRGLLWFASGPTSMLSSLTRLLLCRRGQIDGPLEMSEEEDFEFREDQEHEVTELKQWASLLRSVRSTIVEIVLEQRPTYLSYLLNPGYELSPHDRTGFYPEQHSFDMPFYKHVLKPVFDDGDGASWPNLKSLTFRGINLIEFEEKPGESLKALHDRVLPGVQVEEVSGNYMYFDTRRGIIMTQDGADGLKPHLDPSANPHFDMFDEEFGMLF